MKNLCCALEKEIRSHKKSEGLNIQIILKSAFRKELVENILLLMSLEENASWQNGIMEKECQTGNQRPDRELHTPNTW